MKVVYTAILGTQYDDLKEPTFISEGWKYICFTDQPLTSKHWEIIPVPSTTNPQRQAREIKIISFKLYGWMPVLKSIWILINFGIIISEHHSQHHGTR
jgi:hypothetical protein